MWWDLRSSGLQFHPRDVKLVIEKARIAARYSAMGDVGAERRRWMGSTGMRTVVVGVVAFVLGSVIGGSFVRWRISQSMTRDADKPITSTQPKAGQPGPGKSATASVSCRSVIINGQSLSDQDIQTIESTFRVRVKDGDYWYDRMNGSWGVRGGPTAGFIMAGLNMGGPLPEDASSGDTGVYINGRQLHQIDVARLSLIGPVYRARCWMDGQGNIGLEGQPAFGNIWLAVQTLGGGQKEGILSTWDKTGIAVFGQ